MVALELNQEEVQALRRVLETAASELGFEIANTDRAAMRESLKRDKEIVLRVISDLDAQPAP